MANIDVSKIEGYADMTPEDKIAALEAYEYDDGSNLKSAVDKATHEAAEYKKQLKALQDQQKNGGDELQSLKDEIAELKREKMLADLTAKYTALGYDAELAKSTAEAYADGDTETVFANQKAFADAREKALKAELLKQTPRPGRGGTGEPGSTTTKADIMAIKDTIARQEAIAAHPELFINT